MALTPRAQTIIRLLGVQAAWTYERMAGIGVGHAAAPLLRDLHADHPTGERRAAVARSAEFFNCHPYLAGVAVGAVVRAERDGATDGQVSRLRTALSGPLGALGDQLIWAGEVPILMGLALVSVPWIGAWSVLLVLVIHNIFRFRITTWGLDLGLSKGLGVGRALMESRLPRAATLAQRMAAFTVGLGVPIVAAWLLAGTPPSRLGVVMAVSLLGIVLMLAPATRAHVTGLRFGLAMLLVALLAIGGTR